MPANDLQWISLNDFRPGIKSRVSPGTVSRTPGKVIGVADRTGTFRCQALPDGSLGPMPDMDYSKVLTLPAASNTLDSSRVTISGFHAAGPVVNGGVEFHIAYEGVVTSTHRRFYYWERIRHFSSDQQDTIVQIAPTTENPASGTEARPTWFYSWRADDTDPTAAGLPVIIGAWAESSGGGSKFWDVFPSPATPTSDTPGVIASTLAVALSLAHQGRSVFIAFGTYPHGGNSFTWTQSEDVYFTEAQTIIRQNSVAQTFGMENATGYSAALSTSHSELLLLKKAEGGVFIRGDIADPTVLRLPGIPGAGRNHQRPCNTPLGAVYMTDSGIYLWNGGETAENISRDSLVGTDYLLSGAGGSTDFVDFFGALYYWGDWVWFPNNWVWNPKEQSWWRCEDPTVATLFHMGPAVVDQNVMYAAPATVVTGAPSIYGFNYNVPAQSYQWTSLPLPLGNDKEIIIREIVLVATGIGTVALTYTKTDGTTVTYTFTLSSSTAIQYPRQVANVPCKAIKVVIVATATTTVTPVIHDIRMATDERTHYANVGT